MQSGQRRVTDVTGYWKTGWIWMAGMDICPSLVHMAYGNKYSGLKYKYKYEYSSLKYEYKYKY